MRPWEKILLILIIILALFFCAAYVFMAYKGKAIIVRKLEELTQKKVSVGYFLLTPPLDLELRKLDIAGLGKADSLFISPSIVHLFTGRIVLNYVKVVNPEYTYEKNPPQIDSLSPAGESDKAPGAPGAAIKAQNKRALRLIFKHLGIEGGKIDFIDHTVGPDGIRITVKDINFNLTNLYAFPSSVITSFDFRGNIPWQKGQAEGRVEGEGWVNFYKKDMQATLKVENIDGIYLYPYYSGWFNLGKARIEGVRLNFSSSIRGLNNNVTAECHLELSDITRKPRQPDEAEEKLGRITSAVLGFFKALDQGKVVLNFTIRTKMDRPEFGFSNIKMAFEDKLTQLRSSSSFKAEDIFMVPGKLLEGTVKGVTDLSKALIDGTFAVGNELKKAIEVTFKREPKEKQEPEEK